MASSYIRKELNLVIILHMILLVIIPAALPTHVDSSFCKPFTASPDVEDAVDDVGRPLVYMGETWSKKYYMTTIGSMANFFQAAYSTCARFDLQLATIKTVCEYGIIEKWFLSNYPTDYSAWIAGFRFGDSTRPPPLWTTTGEPLDFSQFGVNVQYIPGPYPPGGYSPIPYPWINCLSISRNCPLFTGAHTNPCSQTPTYPDLSFMWLDCRVSTMRVICEEISYSKEGSMNEVESDD